MKKQLLLIIASFAFTFHAYATQVIVTNSGNNFVPANITINLGDTVVFATTMAHNARQVSLATYTANDTVALPGGFETPYGGGMVIPSSAGIMYYVCVPHAAMGMKGTITVNTLGIESNHSISMQIMQSVSEQYLKLFVTGGAAGQMHVEMLNLSGQVVKTINVELNGDESTTIVQVGDMPKGVYMIRWSYGNVNKAKKIILQ